MNLKDWRAVFVAVLLLANPLMAWSYLFSSRRSDTSQSNNSQQPPSQVNTGASTSVPVTGSNSQGQVFSSNGYQSSSPIPMQRPNGAMTKRSSSGQSFSLERSYSDQEIVKRQSSQGVTSSFSPKGIFEATIDLRDKQPFSLEYRDVEDIFTQPYYFVDRSRFITHFVDDPAKLTFFLRPRKMGKSINCSMLARFLNCRAEPSAGFRRLLNMYKEQEFNGYVRGHSRKYGVIWLDWSTSGLMETSDRTEFEIVLLRYIQRVLREGLESLCRPMSEIRQFAPDGVDFEEMLTADNVEACYKAFPALTQVLNHYTENTVVVLIDDYDDIYKKAAEVEAYDVLDDYLTSAFDSLMSQCGSMISKVACFGTHMLAENGPFRECTFGPGAIKVSTLGSRDQYQLDFGFTREEVKEACDYFKDEARTDDAELEVHYQIVSEEAKQTLYHPYSTAAAIKYGSIDEYWTREHPLNFDAFPFTMMNQKVFGLGDFFAIVHEPQNGINWPASIIPVSYNPKVQEVRWQQEQLLSWLHSEGYAARKQLPCQEIFTHMQKRVFSMVDQQTGFIQALKALKSSFPLSECSVAPLARAFTALANMPHFYKGSSSVGEYCRLRTLIEEMFKAILPFQCFYKSDWEIKSYPMYKVSPNHLVLFVLDFNNRAPDLQALKDRLMRSKVQHQDDHAVTIVACYLDGQAPTCQMLSGFNPSVDRLRFDLY